MTEAKRTVLITGGGIGIGRATALAFGKRRLSCRRHRRARDGGQCGRRRDRRRPAARPNSIASTCADARPPTSWSRMSTANRGAIDVHRRQCRHRPQGAARGADRREMGPHLRHRPQGHVARRSARPCPAMKAQQGRRHRLRLLDHGRRLWLGRACPLFRGQEPASSAWSAASRSSWRATASASTASRPATSAPRSSCRRSIRWGPKAAEAAGAFIPMGRIGEPDEIADVSFSWPRTAPAT